MSELTCRGWWEQSWYGRKEMQDLELTFHGSRLTGQGRDCVGLFTLEGELTEGQVRLLKKYLGAHSVLYAGRYDGEGTLSGFWQIGTERGKWLIQILKDRKPSRVEKAEDVPEFQPAAGV